MRHRPTYRVVVMDAQRPRDGEYIESLGHYDPRTKRLAIDLDRARYWQSVGAQPTGTVARLIRRSVRELAAAPGDSPTDLVPDEESAGLAVELAAEAVGAPDPLGPTGPSAVISGDAAEFPAPDRADETETAPEKPDAATT